MMPMGPIARHLLPYERYMTKEQYITHALAVVNVLAGQILRETNRTAEGRQSSARSASISTLRTI